MDTNKQNRSVYICYHSKDSEYGERIAEDLLEKGFLVSSQDNRNLFESKQRSSIEEIIKKSGAIVVLLSPEALLSESLEKQLAYASIHDINIIPIIVRGSNKKVIPITLATYQHIDFRSLGNYHNSLTDLINALKEKLFDNDVVNEKSNEIYPIEDVHNFHISKEWNETNLFSENIWSLVGDSVNQYLIQNIKLENNILRWRPENRGVSVHWTIHEATFKHPTRDFALSMEITKIEGRSYRMHGLLFGYADNDNFFDIQIDDQEQYFIWVRDNGEYKLLEHKYSSAINQRDKNTLEVLVISNAISFFVNGRKISEINDHRLQQGAFGPSVRLYGPGDYMDLEIANLILFTPETMR